MTRPRIPLQSSDRARGLEVVASELRALADRVAKLSPYDRHGMTDCVEACDIVQGSLLLLADDALAEAQVREREAGPS